MLQALPATLHLRNFLRKSEHPISPGTPYRTRREQGILRNYLPGMDQARTFDFAADYFIPPPAGVARTPFQQNTFDAVICFRLSADLNAIQLEDLLWEATRVCAPGGRLFLSVRSAATAGKYAYNHAAVEYLRGTRWREVAEIGVALLPVDRLPGWLRGPVGRFDELLCRTPLKRMAAFRTYVLEKC